MSEEELMMLIKSVDPQAVRIPPGIKAIAERIEQASRRAAIEEAASIVDAEAENARQEHYYPGVVGAFEECAAAIRALSGAKEENN